MGKSVVGKQIHGLEYETICNLSTDPNGQYIVKPLIIACTELLTLSFRLLSLICNMDVVSLTFRVL